MKYLLITLLAITLIGCGTKEQTTNYYLPSDLSDCKVYYVSGKGVNRNLYVVRCPNSTTSTTHSCGKNCTASNTVIEE